MMTMINSDVSAISKAKTTDSDGYSLKIMTFNVKNLHGNDGSSNSWDNRKTIAVNAINSFGPYIIGMQEAYIDQINYFINNLCCSYASIGKSRYGNTSNEYSNIMYRSDMFNVLESGQFWLSGTPDKEGSFSTYDGRWPRTCTWALFQLKGNSRAMFYYFNTHLSLETAAQDLGAEIILERVSKYANLINVPIFLGGDFNAEETYNCWLAFRKSGFIDTWEKAGMAYNDDCTFNNFTGATDGRHIDWIFYKNAIAVNSIEINRYNEKGRYPSDHYPVQLYVDIPLI